MEEIKFTSYTLSKDVGYNQFIPIRRNDFETSFDKKTLIYEVEKTTYNFEIEIIENKYLWMYATYGNPEPCPPNLYNKSTKKNKKNQRTKEDVELRQQFFSMYDFEKGILFLNQSNKKGILEKIFLECFNKSTSSQIKLPLSALWTPAKIESKVDLPQPFAPSTPIHWPLVAVKLIFLRTFFFL